MISKLIYLLIGDDLYASAVLHCVAHKDLKQVSHLARHHQFLCHCLVR